MVFGEGVADVQTNLTLLMHKGMDLQTVHKQIHSISMVLNLHGRTIRKNV